MMDVPTELEGKMGKCPGCGRDLAFPAGVGPGQAVPVAPPRKSSIWPVVGIIAGVGCFVLLAIGGILAGFLLPALSKAQESARRASCMNNVRQIELSLIQYAGDYDDEYPSALVDENEAPQRRFARLLKLNYLNAPKVFHCPSADFSTRPDPDNLDALTMADSTEASIADVWLSVDWCSYGIDPRVTHTDSAWRAVVADAPDPEYWGPTASSPDPPDGKSNSANHKHDGQNVAYNDGHVKWGATAADDAGNDPNVYGTNKGIAPEDDSNVRYGTGPDTP